MAKTLIKMIVGVVLLAGVFFFALQFWEKQKVKPVVPPVTEEKETPKKTTITSINDVTVLNSTDGAVIQISEIPGPDYKVTAAEQPNGFMLDVPGAQVTLANNIISEPHPLVQSIIASTNPGGEGARIQVNLVPGAAYRERLLGTTLYMDIVGSVAKASPIPIEQDMGGPAKVTTRTKSGKKALKSKTSKVASVRRPVSKPRREPAPAPVADESDALMRELGLSNEPVAEAPAPMQEPVPSDLGPPTSEPAPATESEEPLDLDKMFGDAGGGGGAPIEPPSLEPPTEVASLPPPSAEKFDSSKIANLPALSNLIVAADNGATIVTIEREAKTQYKIFRMRNPDRVVVDFKNAASRLQREYSGVPGTKVQRVTTQQFVGKDGTISRIMFYVDGKADYKQEIRGNSFVLMIP